MPDHNAIACGHYPSRRAAVRAMLDEGMQTEAIASALGIAPGHVTRIIGQINARERDRQTVDLFSCEGARQLKHRLESYWRERGYQITVEITGGQFTDDTRGARFDVRSDLVNGLPLESARIKNEAA